MTHINVTEVLASLSQAKEAWDAVPGLRRQIDDLEAALASKDRLLSETTDKLTATAQEKANAEAKIKQVEEERDQYGFRAIDAEEKLEKVLGVVRPQVTATSPQAEPVAEPVVNPTQDWGKSEGQSATDPTQSSTSVSVASNTGQSEPHPTSETASPVQASTTTGTTEPIADTRVQSDTYPTGSTAQSAEARSTATASLDTAGNMSQGDHGDETSKPFAGRPTWEKPYDMSWDEWKDKGGAVPAWIANR